jgi:hypothetical protein
MITRDREDRLSKQINAICLELTAADEDEIADRIVFDYLWLCVIRDYPDLETAEELASLMADGADATERPAPTTASPKSGRTHCPPRTGCCSRSMLGRTTGTCTSPRASTTAARQPRSRC